MEFYVSNKEKRRRKLRFRLRIYAVFTFFILLLVAIYFAVTNISLLKVQSIEVSGQEKLTKQAVIDELASNLYNNFWPKVLGFDNLLFWPKGQITLANPLISRISIGKNWAEGKILINIEEREKYGMWCGDSSRLDSIESKRAASPQNDKSKINCFWFDKESIIFDKAPEAEDDVIFRVNNIEEGAAPLRVGDQVLRPDLFNNFKKILEFLKDNFSIQTHQWENTSSDLKSFTKRDVQLLFNTRFNPEINLNALKELSLKPIFKKLNYVDLRVENRVYYK